MLQGKDTAETGTHCGDCTALVIVIEFPEIPISVLINNEGEVVVGGGIEHKFCTLGCMHAKFPKTEMQPTYSKPQ